MSKEKAPTIPLKHFKRTKMIATLGPSSDTYEIIDAMLRGGVNGFRLNFSHATQEQASRQIKWVRKASKEYGKPVAIIQDLQGPKIRLGAFEGMISIKKGQELTLDYNLKEYDGAAIPIQYDLSNKVKRGERLFMYDGKIRTTVNSAKDGIVRVAAENNGFVTQKKGINIPDTEFAGDVFTKKDKKDLIWGANQDIDFVAMSFVQRSDDIKMIKRLLKGHGSKALVISKIETKAAVENLEAIVEESDAVMAARGDMAVEIEPEAVPIVTRKIIGLGQRHGKPTIVATQMLASMTEAEEPTRAEVSDVATSVIVGADCVMLSDETASGKFPLEAVKMMKQIILYTQEHSPLNAVFDNPEDHSVQTAISDAAITLASRVEAIAIVALTKSGATARSIAARRPDIPLIMVTSEKLTSQQLAIVYGSKAYVMPESAGAAMKMTDWLRDKKVFKKGDIIVSCSGQQPGKIGGTDTIKVRKLD